MRVMVDTNIIISAMVFKSSKMNAVLQKIKAEHELCIASYAVDETKRILNEKFPGVEADVVSFFEKYPYTLIEPPANDVSPLVEIRDPKDYPVIHAAITGQMDVLLTGDKDFFDVRIDRPMILLPVDFMAKF